MAGQTKNSVIRLARVGDLSDLADLAARSFRDAFGSDNDKHDIEEYLSTSMTLEKLQEEFDDTRNTFLVACPDHCERLAGYAKLRSGSHHSSARSTTAIEIERLYADKPVIGKGIGAALMGACLERAWSLGCDEIWLGVWERNLRAIQFYERWGFSTISEKEFKLGTDMQTDLIMSRKLSGEDL